MQSTITETYSNGLTFNQTVLATNPGIMTILNVNSIQNSGLDANYTVGYSFYVESLVAQVRLPSLPSAELPMVAPEQTAAEKFLEIEKVLTQYPTVSLRVWIDYDWQGWNLEAVIPLQNRKNQYYPLPILKPYLTMGEVKPLPKTAKIGFDLQDDGYGLLGIGDVIRIQCDARKEVSLIPKAQERVGETTSFEQVWAADSSIVRVLPYRSTRKAVYLRNSGNTKIFFAFAYQSSPEVSEPGKKLYLMPGEAWSWENSYFVLPHDLWVEGIPNEGEQESLSKLTIFEAF